MTQQSTFAHAEFAAKRKTTRREKFLARMEEDIPRTNLSWDSKLVPTVVTTAAKVVDITKTAELLHGGEKQGRLHQGGESGRNSLPWDGRPTGRCRANAG